MIYGVPAGGDNLTFMGPVAHDVISSNGSPSPPRDIAQHWKVIRQGIHCCVSIINKNYVILTLLTPS